ncbi:Na/Pi cotransporter family protein [Poseidonocella sp. HB161398]|uniref:Na/Pi cotransporter family protein n=1 Tax=Poseidonocella sp. HB161398 TaxID=2320855 RepID=UPI0011081463|nr:Na/Pi symporter [Poseidonocella sp. HB161398]
MIGDLVNALGGVGLFLFGMFWLTDSLHALAGQRLRAALARFTRTPLSGAATGAVTTALIQSSSATTVTAVGFVSAGLLSFPQALGIIFGANIGTTLTGWLVAILGFKLDLGAVCLPLVFLGAVLRLSGGARRPQIGTALAGFALIFLGIEVLKDSLAGFEGLVTPEDFPRDSLWGRAELVLAGALITLVTQSSSAGVAAALAALGAGAVSLPQAMALVIGMDVGTTFTAVLATLGGSTAARRTGASHVIYNLLTGVMAFVLLGPAAALLGPGGAELDGQIALVAFHSGFNILGVVLVLPVAGPFARLVTALVPARGPVLTGSLGPEMLRDPEAAADAAVTALEAVAAAQTGYLAARLGHREARREDREALRALAEALPELRRFTDAIPPAAGTAPAPERLVSVLHVLDHLGRLYFRATEEARIAALQEDRQLRRLARLLAASAAAASADLAAAEPQLNKLQRLMRRQRERYRSRILAGARQGGPGGEALARRLEAMRWLQRCSYHLWRISGHMAQIRAGRGPVSPRREAALDVLAD